MQPARPPWETDKDTVTATMRDVASLKRKLQRIDQELLTKAK